MPLLSAISLDWKKPEILRNTDSSGMLAMNGKCMRLRHGIWHGMATDHINILLKAHFIQYLLLEWTQNVEMHVFNCQSYWC